MREHEAIDKWLRGSRRVDHTRSDAANGDTGKSCDALRVIAKQFNNKGRRSDRHHLESPLIVDCCKGDARNLGSGSLSFSVSYS